MLQLTSRDEAMLDWINVVRMADVDAIRWALSAYQDDHDGPVSVRRANHWIARMSELGYLGRVRPVYRDRQIVWPTYQASGRSAPRLFRQTMRHELAVASAAGRYLAAGYSWNRDLESVSRRSNQADGIAIKGQESLLVEVELTAKSQFRYQGVLVHHCERLALGVSRVTYLCTEDVSHVVAANADAFVFREQRESFTIVPAFDVQGRWVSGESIHPQ